MPRINRVTHPDGTVSTDDTRPFCTHAVVAAPVPDTAAHNARLTGLLDTYTTRIAVYRDVLAWPEHTVTITRREPHRRDRFTVPDLDTMSHTARIDGTAPPHGTSVSCNINGLVSRDNAREIYALEALLDRVHRDIEIHTEACERLRRQLAGDDDIERTWRVVAWTRSRADAETALRSERARPIEQPERLSIVEINNPKPDRAPTTRKRRLGDPVNDHNSRRDAAMNAVLASIDDVTADRCGWAPCGKALGPNAPSRDFCCSGHQWLWTQANATNPGEICDWAHADQEEAGADLARRMVPPAANHHALPLTELRVEIGSSGPDGTTTWQRLDGIASVDIGWERAFDASGRARIVAEINEAWTTWTDALAEAAGPIMETWAAMRDAGIIPDEAPTDPRERALWTRRNRNNGPTPTRRRGPRRIDPGNSR